MNKPNNGYGSNVKITMSVVICIAVSIVFMLIGIFVIDKFTISGADKGIEYWIGKIINCCATFTIMIAVANLCEESRKKRDTNYIQRVDAVNNHYKELMENGESRQLELFIHQINRANKYEAYIKAQRKKYNRTRSEKRRLKLEKRLLATPDDVWSDVKYVRYHRVTYNLLVSGEYEISEESDGFEMQTNKTQLAIKKLARKVLFIFAFGWFAADICYSLAAFTKEMIIPLIVKVVMILISAYSGVSFGYTVMDRRKNVLKNKLRIFSQFRTRIEDKTLVDEKRFDVEIEKDAFVEKLKCKYLNEGDDIC